MWMKCEYLVVIQTKSSWNYKWVMYNEMDTAQDSKQNVNLNPCSHSNQLLTLSKEPLSVKYLNYKIIS
jgi:hypothetical protein